jgi:hypothetical protein
MSNAEKFIQDCTRNCSNELCAVEDRFGKKVISYHEWLTPDQARKAVEIAREEMVERACRGYCDDVCEKGMCGMCYHKHDGKGQVKNTFKYNECNELQILINTMKDE